MSMCRNGLHQIRGPQDRRPGSKTCIRCSRASQVKYQARCRDARKRLAVIEAALSL
jgi:hypothetical protein